MEKNMRVLIVNFDDLKRLPPVLNLMDVLLRNNVKVSVITFDKNNIRKKYEGKVDFHILKADSNKLTGFITRKSKLRNLVNSLMKSHDYLWTTTDRTVRELGSTVYQHKHIMQLMELISDYPLFPKQHIFMAHLEKYAQKAYKVVVPEYNRAHIQAVWWDLPKLPVVLPNKPSSLKLAENDTAKDIIAELMAMKESGKNLVLYQGIIRKERPLTPFAKAVQSLGDDYRFIVMGDNEAAARELESKFPCVYYIPFITPPDHLKVTGLADVGVLTYQIDKNNVNSSEFNPLYCAPNKIYEYAGFSVPMIGNEIPGLRIPFDCYKIGEICDITDYKDIAEKIKTICTNKESYRKKCSDFYEETNLDDIIINKILR